MKREDVVRLRKLLGVARGNISEWGGPYQTDDARSEILDALPALLALAEAVEDAPDGRVYVIGTGDGDDLLTIDPAGPGNGQGHGRHPRPPRRRAGWGVRDMGEKSDLTQQQHEWVYHLCDAEAYIGKARDAIKRRDFKASHDHVLTACFLLDTACQYDLTGADQ